ncbi:MipA/OmpV family protein [Granulosicoccus sp. 3-233]|uniref:MipA/OmpV family protein n=1 Tax=Granulosicoccus sp. 3-233 TaxID=3417969 RepID=UPI003D348845
MRHLASFALLLSSCLGLANVPATAAEDTEVGFGVYEKPQYPGADEQEWVLLPSFSWQNDNVAVALRAERLFLDFVSSDAVNAGFMVRYDEGRDEGIDDVVVRQLATVPAAAELGLYVESGLPVRWLGWDDPALVIGSVNLRDAVGAGHKGQVLEVSGGLMRDFGSSTSVTVQFIVTRTDRDYNRAYFGVSESESAATGLPVFNPKAGVKDTRVRLVVNHEIGQLWSVGITTSRGRLSDDLADSPVVSLRGEREQWTSGLFVNRRLK